MVKKTKNAASKKAPARRTQTGRVVARRTRNVMDQRVISHVNMVRDPCNAVIGQTAYRGKDGFVNRFSASYDIVANANPCAVCAYWPKTNRVFLLGLATDSTTFSLNFYDVAAGYLGPGNAFLGTNAGETRPVAACITSQFVGTELDRQGFVCTGVVPYRTVSGTTTISGLRQLLQRWERTPDHDIETKWIPSPTNEDYFQVPSSVPTIDSDDNIIITIFSGFASGKLSFVNRITQVTEWQPFYGLGISCPTPNTPDSIGGLEKVRTILARAGHWWLEAASTARSFGNFARVAYGGARMITQAATAVTPMLLTA